MKRSVLNPVCFKNFFVLTIASLLSLISVAQTVTIVPTGTILKPNLIPVNNAVTFSINPIGFGACMNNLSYSWAILNSKKDTLFKSTSSSPNYNFVKEDVYTVALTVKTLPGGSCGANVTRTATSILKVAKEGGLTGAPKPNMFSANALGTTISAYNMDLFGQVVSGPYDYFDPFPADNGITAALSMDDKGNFFYLPTFMSGPNPLTATQLPQAGKVEVWAVDKNGDHAPVAIAKFDMNGTATTELGLFRMGLDQKGNAWILAGDGNKMYATTFKTSGTKVVKASDITTYTVPFESGSAADFQSGDLAFDNNGTMYVLAGSSTGTNIYTMSTNTSTPVLSKKWRVTNSAGQNFGLAVTGTVFDSEGDMFFSALDGIYFIDKEGVSAATGTAIVKKVSENFGLMDLATSQFPAAWTTPFNPGPVLPLKLIRFAGTAAAEKLVLNWTVASNETGNHFEVERSYNGTNFTTQGLVFTTDKEGEASYSFTDNVPVTNKVFYRLKMVNKNQSLGYSNIIFFKAGAQSSVLTLLQNPVTSTLNLNYAAAENKTVEITVYANTGVKLFSQKQIVQKGINNINIALSEKLVKGMYLLEARDGESSQTVRFVKQ